MGTISFRASAKEIIRITTGKPPGLEELLDALNVAIYLRDGSGPLVSDQYRNLPEPLELPQGVYDYFMDASGPAFQLYGADGTFSISTGINTEVSTLLSLKALAGTINFSPEIQSAYPDIRVEAVTDNYRNQGVGISILQEWDISETGTTKYFPIDYAEGTGNLEWQSEIADLTITIIAMNALNDEIRVSKTYTEVVANQHYNILVASTISGTDGSVEFDITLEDEEEINETITFPN